MREGVPRGTTWKFCLCRDPATNRYYTSDRGKRPCPNIDDRRHGTWMLAVRLDGRSLKRSGFPSQTAALAALEHVRDLVKLAEDDAQLRATIVDEIITRSRRGGALPSVDEWRRKIGADVDVSNPDLTVGEWLEEYLRGKRGVKASTLRGIRAHMDAWLVPVLGDVRLSKLKRSHLVGLFKFIEERDAEVAAALADGRDPRDDPRDGRSAFKRTGIATMHRIYATLRCALNEAVDQGVLVRNPCPKKAKALLDPEPQARGRVWSPDQARVFLDHVEGDRLAPLFQLVLLRGLRRGEACGLRWQDVHLDERYLEVAQTLLQMSGRLRFDTPKNRQRRTVSLDTRTVAVLDEHRQAQARERDQARGAYERHNLVFARADGSPTPPEEVSRRFKQLAEEAGLPTIRFHDLRHTAATLMREAGYDWKIISDQLGHSTVKITMDIYTHVLPVEHDEAAENVAALVLDGRRRTALRSEAN